MAVPNLPLFCRQDLRSGLSLSCVQTKPFDCYINMQIFVFIQNAHIVFLFFHRTVYFNQMSRRLSYRVTEAHFCRPIVQNCLASFSFWCYLWTEGGYVHQLLLSEQQKYLFLMQVVFSTAIPKWPTNNNEETRHVKL